MLRCSLLAVLLLLAGCATAPAPQAHRSPCEIAEASYECQVERYHNVNVP